jgi:ribosome-associated protein
MTFWCWRVCRTAPTRYADDAISTDLTDISTRDLALVAAQAADAKKASDIVLVDMRGVVAYTDWLVVATGQTSRQTKAIAEEVRKRVKEETGRFARRTEGEREGEWILLDYLDIVVHIFTPQAREFYRLDRLWREAPQERFEPEVPEQIAPATG